jgi:hypothetical protein
MLLFKLIQPINVLPEIPTFPTILDHVKQLSISKLKEWQYLEPGSYKTGTLTWSRNGQEIGSISIQSNVKAEEPYIQLSYTYNKDQPVEYNVYLTSVSSNLGIGKVWYFICPHTGKRCRKLYGAGKYFLHREAFPDAMYEKQTYSKYMRGLDKAFNLHFSSDELYEELYSKGFTTHYNGKPTKRYKEIMSKLERIRNMEPSVMKYLN